MNTNRPPPCLLHHAIRRLSQVKAAVEMYAQHSGPRVRREVIERHAAEYARVADDGVQPPECVHRGVDDRLAASRAVDRVIRGYSRAARLGDLVDHVVRDAGVGAVTTHRAAEVVDNHRGAAAGQVERIQPPESTTGSGDDSHTIGEINHVVPLIA